MENKKSLEACNCDCKEKKVEKKPDLPTGPDLYMGGDGLPDWMQFTITAGMFAILYWVGHGHTCTNCRPRPGCPGCERPGADHGHEKTYFGCS